MSYALVFCRLQVVAVKVAVGYDPDEEEAMAALEVIYYC